MVFYPLSYYGGSINNLLAMFALFVFLESMINQIAMDIKDISSDKKDAYLTLPIVVGRKRSLEILKTFSFMVTLLFVLFWLTFDYNIVLLILAIISLVINLTSISKVSQSQKLGYLGFAGKFFVWFLFVVFLSLSHEFIF